MRATVSKILPIVFSSIRFITKYETSFDFKLIQYRLHHLTIVTFAASQHQYKRISQSIDYCMYFSGSSPATNANMLILASVHIPFFATALARCALMYVPSILRSCISAPSRRASNKFFISSFSCHCTNLLYTVCHGHSTRVGLSTVLLSVESKVRR